MNFGNTNDGKNQQRLFFKVIVGFVLFWVQSFNGQLTVSGGAVIYSEKENISEQSDKSFKVEEHHAKIYISSDIKILTADTEANFEIVKISDTKKHHASKSKAAKYAKHKIVEAKPAEHDKAQRHPVKEETFGSGSESDFVFSIQQNHSTAVVHKQNQALKHSLKAGFSYFHASVLNAVKTKNPSYPAHFNDRTYSESYSVRPPPAFS